MLDSLLLAVVALVSAAAVWLTCLQKSRRPPLPPGPRGLPIIGNLLHSPQRHLPTYFRKLSQQYGRLFHFRFASSHIIVLGDTALAREILEKRAAKYSARPPIFLWDHYVDPRKELWAFHGKTKNQSIGRRLLAPLISDVRRGKTEALQECEALVTLQSMLDDPKQWHQHLYRGVLSTSLALIYGVQVHSPDDPLMQKWFQFLYHFRDIYDPSASLVNLVPALDRLPFPMPWRRRALRFRAVNEGFHDGLAEEAHKNPKLSGVDTWAKRFMPPYSTDGDQCALLRQVNEAAIDTTTASLHAFVLACLLHPEWAAEVQARIDSVVGEKRTPRFSDRDQLPIVDATAREIVRWRSLARGGVPHMATEDDVITYQGKEYFIPAKSTIFAPPSILESDPRQFPDPDVFSPKRFLTDQGQLDPTYATSAFGFGHRICPGVPLAERSIWILVASILWLFDVERVEGHRYTDDDSAFGGSLLAQVLSFPVMFRLRSEQRARVARQEWALQEKDLTVLLPTE